MKKLIPFLLLFVSAIFSPAQNPKLEWVKGIGSQFDDNGNSVVLDQAGNVYILGTFGGLVDFDPGQGTYNLDASKGANAIVKLTPSGHFVWAKNFGGENWSVASDLSGNIYATGIFDGVVDFDPGAGIYNLVSDSFSSMFILKLNANGNLVWVKQVKEEGASSMILSTSVKADAWGNVYTTGGFWGNIDFDPNSGIFPLSTKFNENIFVLKLRANGDFAWVKQMGGKSWGDEARIMTVDDQGGIYTSGIYRSDADFDPDTSKSFILKPGQSLFEPFAFFISKLDSNGNFAWAKNITDLGYWNAMVTDKQGNLIITGGFWDTTDFDPGAGVFLLAAKWNDIFILKLDPGGNFLWAKDIAEGNLGSEAWAVAVDAAGGIYTTGDFVGATDFDPGTGTFNLTADTFFPDMFISKVDASGNFSWAKIIDGKYDVAGQSIAVDLSGNIYTTGGLFRTVDFDPEDGVVELTSNGADDIFIHKMGMAVGHLSIFPNPSGGVFHIDFPNPGEYAQILIYDVLGALIYKQIASDDNNTIDLSEQADGIYFVKVVYEAGKVMTGKVIKE